ncbi:MAG: BON domain-containing protein, partial [Pseudoxanthomonas sp.]
ALTTALAFTVGCSDRTADDRAAQADPAAVAAEPTMAPAAAPAAMTDADSAQPGTDTWITAKVKSTLLADTDVAGLEINVETVNGVVTLAGTVTTQAQIEEATRLAREIEGVTDVQTTGLMVGAK